MIVATHRLTGQMDAGKPTACPHRHGSALDFADLALEAGRLLGSAAGVLAV